MTTPNPWVRLFLFVPAPLVDQANEVAAKIDPDRGGEETFTTALVLKGESEPVYYRGSSLVREATPEQIDAS